jgi:stress response protein SCP2
MLAGVLEIALIQKTLRVPAPTGSPGDGSVAARQLDAALMDVGFKCSGDLLRQLGGLAPATVIDTGLRMLEAVRGLVGDHVRHNTYFKEFPANVPDTVEFWLECLRSALVDPDAGETVAVRPGDGFVNLLDLPRYGRYQHSYAEMLAAHDDLVASAKDRTTVLHLGGSLESEAQQVYLSLAASSIPLNESDLRLLEILAAFCVNGVQPEKIPVRENRALINRVRLANDVPLLVDTVTDVLRLACALSGGDVTLEQPTRFRSFSRGDRRALLTALDRVVATNPVKLSDVGRFATRWKRLGEGLHPHEFPQLPAAREVFAVARGDRTARSLAARVEAALGDGDLPKAVSTLSGAPGMLLRSLDRLLRRASDAERDLVVDAARKAAATASGRVLLSLRAHLMNRVARDASRMFVNRKGGAWTSVDGREPLPPSVVARVTDLLDDEISRRLPTGLRVYVDPAARDVALPLSGKATAAGLGVLARGSTQPVPGNRLRFLIHWRQRRWDTDFDLSVLLLDEELRPTDQVSWTNLSTLGGVHSGDIVEAPRGATEMIDLDLREVTAHCIVPQVNVFSGEGFHQVRESFFGFMTRDAAQAGQPFEPRTVRFKSELRGASRVALPLAFTRGPEGTWTATWTHLFLPGHPLFNQVEGNAVTTGMLIRAVLDRRYLTVGYLAGLLGRTCLVEPYEGQSGSDAAIYIGLDRPEGLASEVECYPLNRLHELIPA